MNRAVRTALGYGIVMVVALALFLWIRSVGLGLVAPAPAPDQPLYGQAGYSDQFDALLHVLLALAVIILAARTLGFLFQLFAQPPVLAEVIAGIVLGPSLLGYFWPTAAAYVLPDSIGPSINAIAQIGVVLYMFLVGVELNPAYLRRSSNVVLAVSHSSIVLPFLLGCLLSLLLYPMFATSDVPFGVFVLFMGVSMSITAFPVLVRILTDRGMHRSRIGAIALACAAVDDVTAWCLLAFVVGIAKANVSDAIRTFALSFVFVAVMLLFVRRVVRGIAQREEGKAEISQGRFSLILIALLVSAFTAEWIGIHALFGAFLLGATVPHDCALARHLMRRLRDAAVVFFLPVYFAFTGMRTDITLLGSVEQWLICSLIILVASLGKFGGSFAAARLTGLPWRESAALGVLMNTRGLMELIVLNIGLDMKVLSPTLFAMLVLMAVVTTVATTPVIDRLMRERSAPGKPEIDQPEGAVRDM